MDCENFDSNFGKFDVISDISSDSLSSFSSSPPGLLSPDCSSAGHVWSPSPCLGRRGEIRGVRLRGVNLSEIEAPSI